MEKVWGGVGGFWSRGGWIGGSFVNVALPSQLLLSFFQDENIVVKGLAINKVPPWSNTGAIDFQYLPVENQQSW